MFTFSVNVLYWFQRNDMFQNEKNFFLVFRFLPLIFLNESYYLPSAIITIAKIQLIFIMCKAPCWVSKTISKRIEAQWMSATYWKSLTCQMVKLRLKTVAEFLITVLHNYYLFSYPVYFSSRKLCLKIYE